MSDRSKPIFFDHTGRRRTWFRLAIFVLGCAGLSGGILFGIGLFLNPDTPPMKIDTAKLYRQKENDEQVGANYASAPALSIVYAQTAYLRRRSWRTQAFILGGGLSGMYLFILAVCLIARRL